MKKSFLLPVLLFHLGSVAQTYTITTIAGYSAYGFSGDGGPATSAKLNGAREVDVDAAGNVYIADTYNQRIRKVDLNGIITTIAGSGTAGFNGDGIQATSAQLQGPYDVKVDAAGNVFIADDYNNRIRKVDLSGIITTVTGTGSATFSGDGGPAVSAGLNAPYAVTFDAAGNMFIADDYNGRIRKVDVNGTITTVAGNGGAAYSGDGGQATLAQLNFPWSVAVDAGGNLFIADNTNARIRKVDASGIITTVAGNGGGGYSGDGGLATSAQIGYPASVIVDAAGNIYIADANNNNVRKVDVNGIISTIAGTGVAGYSGDGGLSTSARINSPRGLAIDGFGNIYIADAFNSCIRKLTTACPIFSVTASSGTICSGGVYTMSVSGAGSYSVNGVSASNFTFNPINTITYAVTGTSLACASSNTAIATVSVNPLPNISVSGSTAICIHESSQLSASGANSYTWSTNSNNGTISVTPSTTTGYVVSGTSGSGCIGSVSVTIAVNICTSVEELGNGNHELNIYPNPNNGEFTVEAGEYTRLVILNSIGQIVYSQICAAGKTQIYLKEQANGIYFIKASTNDRQYKMRVLKQ